MARRWLDRLKTNPTKYTSTLNTHLTKYAKTWWLLLRHPLDASVLYDRRRYTHPWYFILPTFICAEAVYRAFSPSVGKLIHYVEIVVPWTLNPGLTFFVDMTILGTLVWFLALLLLKAKPSVDRTTVARRARDMLICYVAGPVAAVSLLVYLIERSLFKFFEEPSLASVVFMGLFILLPPCLFLFYGASVVRRLFSQTWPRAALLLFLAILLGRTPELLCLTPLSRLSDSEQVAARGLGWVVAAEVTYHVHFGRYASLRELHDLRLDLPLPFLLVPPADFEGYNFEINAQDDYYFAFARPKASTPGRSLCADAIGLVFLFPRENMDIRECRGKLLLSAGPIFQ